MSTIASPPVKVTPLEKLNPSIRVSLGDPLLEKQLEQMLNLLAARGPAFLLEWHGSRIPRGAIIQEHSIAWTQHGIVRTCGGAVIGYYERIQDRASPDDQVMLVWLAP